MVKRKKELKKIIRKRTFDKKDFNQFKKIVIGTSTVSGAVVGAGLGAVGGGVGAIAGGGVGAGLGAELGRRVMKIKKKEVLANIRKLNKKNKLKRR